MKPGLFFLLGVGTGAGLALLYAPHSGEKTQKLITKKVQKGVNQATAAGKKGLNHVAAMGQKGFDEVAAAGRKVQGQVEDLAEMVQKEKDRVANAFEAGVEAYEV